LTAFLFLFGNEIQRVRRCSDRMRALLKLDFLVRKLYKLKYNLSLKPLEFNAGGAGEPEFRNETRGAASSD
jgi:phosphopantetheinyl transferase